MVGKLRRWVLRLMFSSNLGHNNHESWLIDAEISTHCHVGRKRCTDECLAGEDSANPASKICRLIDLKVPLQLPRGLSSRSRSSTSLSKYAPHQTDGVALPRARSTNSRTLKGYVAVYVGQSHHQRERFLIPISHLSHPEFQELLKRAEKEFGFEQKAGLLIPCSVSEFQQKLNLIEPEDHHHSHCMSLEKSSWSRTRSARFNRRL